MSARSRRGANNERVLAHYERKPSEKETTTTFPKINVKPSHENFDGNVRKIFSENENKQGNQLSASRYKILPPIDMRNNGGICSPTNLIIPRDNSSKSVAEMILECKSSILEKPTALPPIESSDGVPSKYNMLIKQNFDRLRQEKELKVDPQKRTKTRTVHSARGIKRADSFEMVKAEKIRCRELEKYENQMNINKNARMIQTNKSNMKQLKKARYGKRNRNRRNKISYEAQDWSDTE